MDSQNSVESCRRPRTSRFVDVIEIFNPFVSMSGARLRLAIAEAVKSRAPLQVAGAINAYSARLAEMLGFKVCPSYRSRRRPSKTRTRLTEPPLPGPALPPGALLVRRRRGDG